MGGTVSLLQTVRLRTTVGPRQTGGRGDADVLPSKDLILHSYINLAALPMWNTSQIDISEAGQLYQKEEVSNEERKPRGTSINHLTPPAC